MLVHCGSYSLVESVQTGTAKHRRTVVLTEVRETGIRLKWGGVL